MLTFPPDFTFVIQFVSFLILWQILRRLAWMPMLRVLEERSERTDGNRKKAAEQRAEAERAARRYEEELARARAEVAAALQGARARIAAEEQALLAEARKVAQARLQETREQLAREFATARAGITRQADELGRILAQRVLGRNVP